MSAQFKFVNGQLSRMRFIFLRKDKSISKLFAVMRDYCLHPESNIKRWEDCFKVVLH